MKTDKPDQTGSGNKEACERSNRYEDDRRFVSSDVSLEAVAHWREGRPEFRPERMFVLLLGPSSVGKSTIITELNNLSGGQYRYVTPFMTRQLRAGETDKISVTPEIFAAMQAQGTFIYVNELYGVRYGTPLTPITQALSNGEIPILDFPLAAADYLKRPEYDLLNIYILPGSISEWERRMSSAGRNVDGRYQAGLQELALLQTSDSLRQIDFRIVNGQGQAQQAAQLIRTLVSGIKSV